MWGGVFGWVMPGYVGGVLGALDPTTGDTLVERYGPLAVVLVYLGLTVLNILGWLPQGATSSTAYGMLGVLAGGYLRHNFPQAAPPQPPQFPGLVPGLVK